MDEVTLIPPLPRRAPHRSRKSVDALSSLANAPVDYVSGELNQLRQIDATMAYGAGKTKHIRAQLVPLAISSVHCDRSRQRDC
jgi:hypothetical protein